MRKGVQCYTIRNHMNDREELTQSFQKIRDIGYDCVQAGAPRFMEVAAFKALADDIGLTLCSGYASFEKMLADPAEIKAAVAIAQTFDTPWVAIGTLPANQRESVDGYKRFAQDLNRIAAVLKKEGCALMYHHHALEFYSFGGGKHGMDILFDETDPEGVLFTLDTHWLVSGGVNPADWIYKCKGRTPLIHFKDYAITSGAQAVEGVSKTFAEVGEGNLDWPAIVKACHDTGITYAIVEQDSCKGCPFDSLALSYANMLRFQV